MEANEKSELISIPKLNFSRSFVLLTIECFLCAFKKYSCKLPHNVNA